MTSTRLLPLLTLLALAAPARAADDVIAARQHNARAMRLFDLRRYHEAAKEFEAAYEAKDEPSLLYNIAQAYRLAGENGDAVGAYKSFLRRNPDATNRAEVQNRITELEQLIKAQKATQERTPTTTIPPTPGSHGDGERPAQAVTPPTVTAPTAEPQPESGRSAGFTKKVAGGAIAGAGVAAIAVGAIFVALAAGASSDLSNPKPGAVFDPGLEDTFKTDRLLGISLLAGGAVVAAVGTTVLVLGLRQHREAPTALVPVIGPHHVGASLSVSF